MNITEQTIIGELVAADYRTASVFKNMALILLQRKSL